MITTRAVPGPQAQRRFLWRTTQVNQPRLTVENLSEYNVARTVARRAGASLLTAVRLSRRVDLLTRLIYVPLGDSRWAHDHGAEAEQYCSHWSLIHWFPPRKLDQSRQKSLKRFDQAQTDGG
jgi:hypothetical protein